MKKFQVPMMDIQRFDAEEAIFTSTTCQQSFACEDCYCTSVGCAWPYDCNSLKCGTLASYFNEGCLFLR